LGCRAIRREDFLSQREDFEEKINKALTLSMDKTKEHIV
jgi:hypothetical protein